MDTYIGIILYQGLAFRFYWGYIGIMEKKMETTIGIIGVIQGYIGIISG